MWGKLKAFHDSDSHYYMGWSGLDHAKKWLGFDLKDFLQFHHGQYHHSEVLLPELITLHATYRMLDGSENNPLYDGIGGQFLRADPNTSYYADGIELPAGDTRPSAREISNVIFNQTDSDPNAAGLSNMFWLWGQFVDHDIDLTGGAIMPGAFNISVPTGDPHFDPNATGTVEIHLTRSGFDETTGGMTGSQREQVNDITPFIDGSMIYGVDEVRNDFIRDVGGKLKVSEGDLLPYNTAGLPNAGGPGDSLFLAGDIRANEHVALTSLHTLFVREHNRLVDEINELHPEFTDEQLYQEAKVLVEAELQAITFNDFLPLLLGEGAIDAYSGYDSTVNPEIANLFATAAYRFGHTMLASELNRLSESGDEYSGGHLSLQQAFFAPYLLQDEGSLDSLMRGMSATTAESLDTLIVDDVRNFLFGQPGSGGFDLAALNIQRGRDHGLPDYNSAREAYGLDALSSFDELTSDTALASLLSDLYGDINNVDVFVGGLAEEVHAGLLGELFYTIVLEQFLRIRDGDQLWYENRLTPEEIDWVNDLHLSDILKANTDIDYLQENVFISFMRLGGDEGRNILEGSDDHDLIIGFGGRDTLYGHDNDDELFGGRGNDRLFGGEGDDRLIGEWGNDFLQGGAGDDEFVITSGVDSIADWAPGDKIDISYFNVNYENLSFTQLHDDTLVHIENHPDVMLKLLDVDYDSLSETDFIF